MPHVDGMSLPPGIRREGESRFAEPVAAITAAVISSYDHVRTAFARWQARRSEQALLRSYARKSWEIRKRDEDYARATDLADLERMERDWDRRDGGGMRTWDWR
jgi:hypothetical protein